MRRERQRFGMEGVVVVSDLVDPLLTTDQYSGMCGIASWVLRSHELGTGQKPAQF